MFPVAFAVRILKSTIWQFGCGLLVDLLQIFPIDFYGEEKKIHNESAKSAAPLEGRLNLQSS